MQRRNHVISGVSGIIPFILLLIVLCLPCSVSAAVVINEFSSATQTDWVELMNTSTESADLAGLRLRDGSATNRKDLSGLLEGNAVADIAFANYLNKDGDTVMLLRVSGESEIPVDKVSYGREAALCAPDPGQTIGRRPDGSGPFMRIGDSSRGAGNADAVAAPCPTPSTVPAPTPASAVMPAAHDTAVPTRVPPPTAGAAAGSVTGPAAVAFAQGPTPVPNRQSQPVVIGVQDAPLPSGIVPIDGYRTAVSTASVSLMRAVRLLALAGIAAGGASMYTTLHIVRKRG